MLTVLSGLAWTIVYIEAIRLGFKYKTYAMPMAALSLNIAWEWTYAVYDLMHNPQLQAYVNLVWALADVLILYTFFRFGRREFPKLVSRPLFISWGIAIIASSFIVQWLFIAEFGITGSKSAAYSAFLQNLLIRQVQPAPSSTPSVKWVVPSRSPSSAHSSPTQTPSTKACASASASRRC